MQNLFDPNYDDEPDEPDPLDEFITPEEGESILADRADRERRLINRAERRRNRKGLPRVAAQNERAEDLGVAGELDAGEWKRWAGCFDGCCAYCGERPRALCIEHVVPVSRGGENTIYNVVPACADCNMGKGPKEPLRWLERTSRLDGFVARVAAALARMEQKGPDID